MTAGRPPHGNITRAIVERSRLIPAQLDEDARQFARACLLDWLGVTLLGSSGSEIDLLVAEATAEGGGAHALVGRPERVRMNDAALINGVASHLLDYDDGLPAMTGHATVTIAPALFALAGEIPANGRDFLAAFATGVEAAGCIGRLIAPDHYVRGFHATGTIGAFASAAACAALIGLDDERTGHALALAGTRAAGLKASFGTAGKPLHAGWAALTGLTGARWAARGLTAALDILGDAQGFAATHASSRNVDDALAPAPGGCHILDTRFKRFASCGVTHPGLDALFAILGDGTTSADEVRSLVIRIGREADRICNIAEPRSGMEAKFSVRNLAAMAILGDDLADPASFADAHALRGDVRELAGRIVVELVDAPPTHASVTLVTNDGRARTEERRGSERAPGGAVLAQVRAKFAALTRGPLRQDGSDAVIAALDRMDGRIDVPALFALLQPSASG